MYKRSWPTVIISLMIVGVMFLGFGILAVFSGYGAPAVILMLIGLAMIAGGICLLCWYQKNKTRSVRGTKQMVQGTQNDTNKMFIRTIGKWMIIIAIAILGINIICRLAGVQKSKEYVQVTGYVTKIQESTELVRAGNRMTYESDYMVWINFQPVGWTHEDGIVENYVDDIWSVGDTVAVLYPKDALYDAYAAKKDWLTGGYLPARKDYDLPLIIAAILFVVGVVFMTVPSKWLKSTDNYGS